MPSSPQRARSWKSVPLPSTGYADLYGNHATKAWNPRGCPKGFTMQRRVYGPYRLKGPVLVPLGVKLVTACRPTS